MHRPFDLETIGEGLAFAESEGELRSALSSESVVINSPPGSGKTTLVPPTLANYLQDRGRGQGSGRLVVTAPRRIAVKAAAQRLSSLDGSPLGSRIGYTMRGERAVRAETIIEFTTPGVLLRRVLNDPGLEGIDGVVLDEIHLRSIEMDLLLGMIAEIRELRGDLVVAAMSATINPRMFADLLGNVPMVMGTGRQFPVQIAYAPFADARFNSRGVSRGFLDHVVQVTTQAARAHPNSDVLVFLPGRSEISYAVSALSAVAAERQILPLYSGVEASIANEVLRGAAPGEKRRIIVSTDVAESSLTVPGVNVVVDSCLAREVRRDTQRGMSGLVTVTAARASCEQRSGRAGRLSEGWAYRCISDADYAAARSEPTPEILVSELTDTALKLAAWGTPGGKGLALLDSPPVESLNEAHGTLQDMGALTGELRPTELGRTLAGLPLPPLTGKGLLVGSAEFGQRAAAEVIALISMGISSREANLVDLHRELIRGQHPQHGEWRKEVTRLARLSVPTAPAPRSEFKRRDLIGVIAGFAGGRIARLTGESYLLASGTRGALPTGSSLMGEPWLVVTNIARSGARDADHTGALIMAAAPLSPEAVGAVFDVERVRRLSVEQGRVEAREEQRIGAIVISSTPVRATLEESRAELLKYISDEGIGVLPWTPTAERLRGRLALLHAHVGDPWPAVDDERLSSNLDWLRGFIVDPALAKVPVEEALRSMAGPRIAELDSLTPVHIPVASGRKIPVQYSYPARESIHISVKLQECFGMVRNPMILGGRVPVAIELLSPAGRVLARTMDLEFFWREVYPQVRSENRARYAKHPWPQDPSSHAATAATTNKLRRR